MMHCAQAAILCAGPPAVLAHSLMGHASIIRGHTRELRGTRIRLRGTDAPESSQLCRGDDSLQYRCGAKAANELDTFVARRPVDCSPVSLDQYGRTVAVCSINGVDLAEWLIRNRLALDGLHTQRASTIRLRATLSMRGEGYGRAATLGRGCFERA